MGFAGSLRSVSTILISRRVGTPSTAPVIAAAKPAPKVQPKPVAVEVKKIAPVVIAEAKPQPVAVAKPMVAKPVKSDPIVAKAIPKVQKKPVVQAGPKKTEPPVIAKAPVVKAAPESMLLANVGKTKSPAASKNFPKGNTQTASEKTTPAPEKKSSAISLSSMLGVDLGASAPH